MKKHLRLGLLVLLALGLVLALFGERQGATLTRPAARPADYELEDILLTAHDASGRASWSLAAPRLTQPSFDATARIEQPRFTFRDDAGRAWRAQSRRGLLESGSGRIELHDTVRVETRDGVEGHTLATEALTVFAREGRAVGNQPVTISGGGSVVHGRTLDADLRRGHLRLSAVEGHHVAP
jgi:LPS export ABC transporter protein LptC